LLYWYRIYGLNVLANRPLPSIATIAPEGSPELTIELGRGALPISGFNSHPLPRLRRGDRDDDVLQVHRASDGSARFWFRYSDGVELIVDEPARKILASWPAHFCLEDAAVYLLGPALGFYLRLLGTVSLHASAFELDGHAIAIAGPGGAGKSTLIASLAQSGYRVLSEDLAPIRESAGQFAVLPGYPIIRLWPSSVEHLFGERNAMPQLTPSWDKRSWSELQGGVRFGTTPLDLRAVYILAARETADAPRVESMSPAQTLIGLLTNTYVNYLLTPEQRALEFEVLGRLASRLPVKRLVPHADIARLNELKRSLLSDCALVQSGEGG
jgi:hypothetical protein